MRALVGGFDRDSVDGGSDSGSGDGDGDSAGGSEDPFHVVFRAIQELDMIVEEGPSNTSAIEASGKERNATEEDAAAAAAAAATQMDVSTGKEVTKAVRSRAFWRASGESGAALKGRGFSRSGSVRFAHHRSSGGSSGFYRDAGYLGEDHWQSVSGSLPDLAPRLPAQWTGGNAKLSEPSQPLTPTTSARGSLTSQAPHGNVGGGIGSAGAADPRVSSNRSASSTRSALGTSRSGRGTTNFGGSGGIVGGASISSSFRAGRSFSANTDLLGGNDRSESSSAGGAAATAAASALLYGVGGSARGSGSSRQSMFAIGREGSVPAWGSTGQGPGAGTFPAIPPNKESSSKIASFMHRESLNDAPRLQLSEHGVSEPQGCVLSSLFLPHEA